MIGDPKDDCNRADILPLLSSPSHNVFTRIRAILDEPSSSVRSRDSKAESRIEQEIKFL